MIYFDFYSFFSSLFFFSFFQQQPPLDIDFGAADKNYNLVSFRGVPQNPTFRVEELENLVTSFESRADDVFICTYPKVISHLFIF